MPLRTTNDAEVIEGALAALANILIVDTQVALAGGTVMINDDGPLQTKKDLATPAVLLLSDQIVKTKLEWRQWQIESFTVQGKLLDLVTEDPRALPDKWYQNFEDAGRMLANVEDNPSLLWQGRSYAVTTLHLDILSREQKPITKDYGSPMILVQFVLVFKLPPYISTLPTSASQPS